VGVAQSPSNFTSIAWSTPGDKENGIIAGGMDDGAVTLWNPSTILNSQSDQIGHGCVSVQNIHDGFCVNAIEFNP
jgi:protein transport protein SEC31